MLYCITHCASFFLTADAPENRVISAIGDGCGIGGTVLPQVGPVPGHLDNERSSLSSYLGDSPVVHSHGAQHEQPSHRGDQESKYLDQTFPHFLKKIKTFLIKHQEKTHCWLTLLWSDVLNLYVRR